MQKNSTCLSRRRTPIRPWDKTLKKVTMESRNTAPRDDRLAARKALLDELTRLRDQFSAGWFNVDQNEAFTAPQAPRFAGLPVRTARPPGRGFSSAGLSG
jgi:hypothetical protein